MILRDLTLAPAFTHGSPAVLARRSRDGALVRLAASGTGTMGSTPTVITPTGWGGTGTSEMFAADDITGDARPDLVVRNAAGDLVVRNAAGDLQAWQGDGAGRLTGAVRIGQGWNGFASIGSPGDLNADGRADLVGRRGDGSALIYTTRPGGGFNAPVATAAAIGELLG